MTKKELHALRNRINRKITREISSMRRVGRSVLCSEIEGLRAARDIVNAEFKEAEKGMES